MDKKWKRWIIIRGAALQAYKSRVGKWPTSFSIKTLANLGLGSSKGHFNGHSLNGDGHGVLSKAQGKIPMQSIGSKVTSTPGSIKILGDHMDGIKNVGLENPKFPMEDRLLLSQNLPIQILSNGEKPPTTTTDNFNDGTIELQVGVKEGLLDTGSHSVVTFIKGNGSHNTTKSNYGNGAVSVGRPSSFPVGGNSGRKVDDSRRGKKLNKIFRDPGRNFKVSSSSRVPLTKSVNSMVDLISAQLVSETGKGQPRVLLEVSVTMEQDKQCVGINFSRVFKEYNLEYKPDIMMGFSRVIWIGWKDSIKVEVVKNNPQFILTHVLNNSIFEGVPSQQWGEVLPRHQTSSDLHVDMAKA
ncbi:hypothetical protein Goshw_015898 [Gossypium schwendimanii]|uniref:DUF4283 domain-containing protein n=1 Tax=Gossypium schwendimanii TaxID=34291 RepID=A0A7J9N1H1_GOSSC|nr:hypothetical protein [Gossypium schwendimanii]